MTSSAAIFDSSIFIDLFRHGRHLDRMESFVGLIRTSAVVLAELQRGATNEQERQVLHSLRKNHPVWVPTEGNWRESSDLLRRMRQDYGFTVAKLRDLHFDVLIALTARSFGARLITSNATDFERIKRYRNFNLELW
jgi:predicted nucleic acid-binding protein